MKERLKDFWGLDTPFLSFMKKIGWVFLLNIMFAITSIPVVTVGASAVAMYTILNKMIAEAYKIKDYGFDVDIIYDWDGDLLGNKDAPIDKGRQVYSKLYRERKNISEFPDQKNNKEEPVNEIPVED